MRTSPSLRTSVCPLRRWYFPVTLVRMRPAEGCRKFNVRFGPAGMDDELQAAARRIAAKASLDGEAIALELAMEIVLHKIGSMCIEKGSLIGKGKQTVPFETHQLLGQRIRSWFVHVFNIPSMYIKIGM